ncbi:glycosyltransferase family A protein [Staphylococcus saprophyticus]|nr:glycosyltransferase family A protein [Staphylococcus saprophyticus]MDW4280199.1 glycosyltransferase family A protein [Staphylococcus saprophyticus]MDW4294926.1 glycosyltransferase family A protein [Staphylococcus saprophyticus]MDW4327006.1 glycosyltransferase family A protein [Staphylococcus saprophyticus]MDW4347162.1 glycosyltransferase family A protein [Staphylococcus saprophyticus]MDW4452860.1 glycosyltransferase family A protein [Staphylococcus saprophyticus]
MPTYNNGSKLEHTIHSVLQQTMDKSDFEFIIIDDHSNDNKTVEIIRHYLVKYPELIKFKQLRKNSGNASIPRNHGIKMSKAEYIFFLDSDDLLHPNTLSDLYHYGLKHNSDLIIGKYGVQGKGRGVSKAAFEKGNIPQADIIENSLFYTLSVLKMFKRSVIVKQKFMFKTNAKTAEDQLFTIEFLMNSKKYSIKTDYEYYIVVNDFSNKNHLSTNKSKPKSYFSTISEIYKAIYSSKIYKDKETRDKLAGKYTTRLFRHGQQKHFALSNLDYKDKIEWLDYLSKTMNQVPRSLDKYVTSLFHLKLEAIRQNDLLSLMIAEKILKGEQ